MTAHTKVSLSQQMLEAADIIEAFNTEYADIYNLDAAWRPSELRREAEHRRAEENEAAEREGEADELARSLHEAWGGWGGGAIAAGWDRLTEESREYWTDKARLLIRLGVRKGDPA